MKAEALPQGWSAQWAELWALAQALRHAEGKRVNIYTDPRYAFATLHVHGAIFFMKEKEGWWKLPDQRLFMLMLLLFIMPGTELPSNFSLFQLWES